MTTTISGSARLSGSMQVATRPPPPVPWVITGTNQSAISTDNAETWSSGGSFTGTPRDLKYGNGVFLSVINGNAVARSTDNGVTWTNISLPPGPSSFSGTNTWDKLLTNGSGQWVIIPQGYFFPSSVFVAVSNDDGQTWTTSTISNSPEYGETPYAYGGGRYLCMGQYGGPIYSDNGTTWSEVSTPELGNFTGLAYDAGAGRFVTTEQSSRAIRYSDDSGNTWTTFSLAQAAQRSYIAYGAGKFVTIAPGGELATSPDGATWTTGTTVAGSWASLRYGGGRFVLTGSGSTRTIAYSTDGTTWTTLTAALPTSTTWGGGAAYGSGT